MAKVSVIIPVYNTEKYLRRCLDSVCNQTLRDIEIICINDCSTDNSLSILEEYAGNDNRIKLIDFKENKGAAVARNTGIDMAEGEYIGFVDSDDFVDLDFYEKLYTKAVETGADAVKGNIYLIDDEHKEPYIHINYDLNTLIKLNHAYFYFTFTTAIFNRKFILNNNINFPANLCHLEDPFFTINAAFYYTNVQLVDSAKYFYDTSFETRKKKCCETTIIQSLCCGAEKIIDLINNKKLSETHYLIVFNFVLKQLTEWCDNFYIENNQLNLLVDTIKKIISSCKYKDQLLSFIFNEKRKIFHEHNKNEKIRKLRQLRKL